MVENINKNNIKAEVKNLNFYYNDAHILKNNNLIVTRRQVTALIGPSGSGKTTFLRCFNRLHELYHNNRYDGEIILYPEGINILSKEIDPILIRMQISMVFQKPNPFPRSIYENVAYGLRIRGVNKKAILDKIVEKALKDAALWDEVNTRLYKPAFELSGGQQQRLCIARALATDPRILLFDEPTAALDPIAAGKIEDLIIALKEIVTVIIVTHNMQQAARISDYTAFMYLGEIIEFGETIQIFTRPKQKLTENYISGHFG